MFSQSSVTRLSSATGLVASAASYTPQAPSQLLRYRRIHQHLSDGDCIHKSLNLASWLLP